MPTEHFFFDRDDFIKLYSILIQILIYNTCSLFLIVFFFIPTNHYIFNCLFLFMDFSNTISSAVYRIGNTELLNVICVVLRLHLGIFNVNVHSREKLSVIFTI